jgi:asparagine synthase (glutamine-hydrolysing)
MRNALAHRGPDDAGIQVIDNVALVHTRLSIVDLSANGHQPMSHPGGEWWLAYNGEIYNHGDLRSKLDASAFVGTSDTETLLFSLERWGQDVVSELGGQFAFAALDVRGDRLLLCRDRFGIKPLYLSEFDGGVWFASEPAALIAAGAPDEPVDTAWDHLFNGTYLGGEGTLLKGITRLPPGSWTEVSLQDADYKTWRWHVPADDVDPIRAARLKKHSRSELVAELETTLRDAVHRSLLADTTVGTLCSGGVDSSLITALAAEKMPEIVAFGASFAGDGRMDEGLAARRVAEALGVEIEVIEVTPASWRSAFVPATVHYGVPIANASAVTVAQLANRARECGVKVLLTGEGADELFGGYTKLHAQALAAFLPWYDRVVHAAEPMVCSDPMRALNPANVLRRTRELVGAAVGPAPTNKWLPVSTPGANQHVPTHESVMAYAHHEGGRSELEAGLLSQLDYSLCWLLNRMDKNVMQASVEARVPFLEPDVVKLALNLPLEARVGPWSKGILRDVGRKVLPWSIAHRPKIYGMAFDARTWIEEAANEAFLTDGLLRDTLQIPQEDFDSVIKAGNHVVRVRLWSAEVWCRSVFAGHSIQQIEQDIWL